MSGSSSPSTKARVLLVEDDRKLSALIAEYLVSEGFAVVCEARGDRAIERVGIERPDLVILDVMLPGLDGFEVCRRLRPGFTGPVLMLTARGGEVDEILGLELGADDFLSKPVRPRVLLTRVRALLRREERHGRGCAPGASGPPDRREVAFGSLVIDPDCRSVARDGEEIVLTTAEFDLLWLLVQRRGSIVTRDEIYSALRGIEYDGIDRSVDLRIARLRRKLEDDGRHPRLIKSVRGSGYLLAASP